VNIHRVTYNPDKKSCTLYFIGCNFNCVWCYWKEIYRLEGRRNIRFLNTEEVLALLGRVMPERVNILSGDPDENEEFMRLPMKLKKSVGCHVGLSTNGYLLPDLDGVDHVNISLKAFDDSLHVRYTGRSNKPCFSNLRHIHNKGIGLSASSVYIPGLIEGDEIERIAGFIAGIDDNIPYRVIGYMKVSGLPFREPDPGEVERVSLRAGRYLKNIVFSRSSGEDYTGIIDLFTNYLRK
jgi:pyruvate-formate lyase-activating enzyme